MNMKIRFITVLLILACIGAKAQGNFTEQVEAIVQKSNSKSLEEPVVFIGSSSIRMWETLEQDFPEFPVLNHGFGGSEYSDLIQYQEQLIEEFEPSMVVVYAGDNDIANGEEPAAIAEEAEVFIDGLRRIANGAPVVVLSAKPSIARWELNDKYTEFNGKLDALVSTMEHAVFVDVWGPMLDKKGEVNEKLFIEDGLHMNEKGYEIWKNALKPFLSR